MYFRVEEGPQCTSGREYLVAVSIKHGALACFQRAVALDLYPGDHSVMDDIMQLQILRGIHIDDADLISLGVDDDVAGVAPPASRIYEKGISILRKGAAEFKYAVRYHIHLEILIQVIIPVLLNSNMLSAITSTWRY